MIYTEQRISLKCFKLQKKACAFNHSFTVSFAVPCHFFRSIGSQIIFIHLFIIYGRLRNKNKRRFHLLHSFHIIRALFISFIRSKVQISISIYVLLIFFSWSVCGHFYTVHDQCLHIRRNNVTKCLQMRRKNETKYQSLELRKKKQR